MSTPFALSLAAAICLALISAAVLALTRASRRAEAALEGPDTLAFLQELDAHLEEYVAADPALADRFDRLWAAIRDEQQNHKGDQP